MLFNSISYANYYTVKTTTEDKTTKHEYTQNKVVFLRVIKNESMTLNSIILPNSSGVYNIIYKKGKLNYTYFYSKKGYLVTQYDTTNNGQINCVLVHNEKNMFKYGFTIKKNQLIPLNNTIYNEINGLEWGKSEDKLINYLENITKP